MISRLDGRHVRGCSAAGGAGTDVTSAPWRCAGLVKAAWINSADELDQSVAVPARQKRNDEGRGASI
jgi:hypothetical protein